ncbi:MAG: Shedu anti-phage system protein SduA domain-containing protein [Steroidobacteraceae bacterium]
MTLRVLEITPGGIANLHERWNRLGIYATEVSFETAIQTITTAGTTELVVDAVVIREATYASIQLSDQIRSLPETVAMIDGKKWCSVPIIILAPAILRRDRENLLDEEGDVKVRDVALAEPNDKLELEQFEALINRPDVSELQLQEFFEEHSHFLSALHTSLPHVRLPAKNGSILIPDFILRPIVAQERDSKWEVLDLKLPQEKLLAGKGSRARLSSSVMKAIRQLRDYHENIQHPDHAEQIEALLGHRLKYPRLGVLIGRLANTDVEALEREQQYEARVRIVTYDEILQQQQALLGA